VPRHLELDPDKAQRPSAAPRAVPGTGVAATSTPCKTRVRWPTGWRRRLRGSERHRRTCHANPRIAVGGLREVRRAGPRYVCRCPGHRRAHRRKGRRARGRRLLPPARFPGGPLRIPLHVAWCRSVRAGVARRGTRDRRAPSAHARWDSGARRRRGAVDPAVRLEARRRTDWWGDVACRPRLARRPRVRTACGWNSPPAKRARCAPGVVVAAGAPASVTEPDADGRFDAAQDREEPPNRFGARTQGRSSKPSCTRSSSSVATASSPSCACQATRTRTFAPWRPTEPRPRTGPVLRRIARLGRRRPLASTRLRRWPPTAVEGVRGGSGLGARASSALRLGRGLQGSTQRRRPR
jgi:hypothetical protein